MCRAGTAGIPLTQRMFGAIRCTPSSVPGTLRLPPDSQLPLASLPHPLPENLTPPLCTCFRFAEIVPAAQRNLVYAFDRCFEGAVAAFAAPLVGLLAEKWYGFSGASTVTGNRERDLANARALGSALLAFLAIPWFICLCVYSGTSLGVS